MKKTIFYRAADGFTADVIPFFDRGEFHLFYLHDYRNRQLHGEGTPWYRISTKDFVSFDELGQMIPRGQIDEQDLYVFTGCVIRDKHTFHLFYTGHNPHLRNVNKPEQAVMHAISEDLTHWTKLPEDTFYAPATGYEPHDWRDPYVYFDKSSMQWVMLLAARTTEGTPTRRGVTALCTSLDLKRWKVQPPLYAPELFFTHECPDLFRIGSWWYLIFSEFSDRRLTRYRMARKPEGPWLTPIDDQFDGRAYYAAKSAASTTERVLVGWVPTKEGQVDTGVWQWGGNLMAHGLHQRANGELGEHILSSISQHFSTNEVVRQSKVILDANAHAVFHPLWKPNHSQYRLSATLIAHDQATRFGLALRYDETADHTYLYSFDISRQQLSFDQFPNEPWRTANFDGVSRSITLEKNQPIKVELLVEDDVCVLYVNNDSALSARMYRSSPTTVLALCALDGIVEVSDLVITTPGE